MSSQNKTALDVALRLIIIGGLIFWSFWIVSPFILPLIWAAIIAVAVYPLYRKLEKLLGDRPKLSATIFTALMVAMLVIPLWAVSGSVINYAQLLASIIESGAYQIPPPEPTVREWPVIGHKAYDLWLKSSENLPDVIEQFQDQIVSISKVLLESVAGFGFTMLQFLFSTIIAGVFLANRKNLLQGFSKLILKLAGPSGESFIQLTGATIRSVTQGVLGIALLQSVFAYFGFAIAGVPGAAFWAIGVLILAIVQMPPTILILPLIIYVFYTSSTTVGVIFAIYMIIVSISDTFLKPLFLGRGVDVPMLAILVGAIGGMIAFGIIGLFVGAVVLAIFYKLYLAWLNTTE